MTAEPGPHKNNRDPHLPKNDKSPCVQGITHRSKDSKPGHFKLLCHRNTSHMGCYNFSHQTFSFMNTKGDLNSQMLRKFSQQNKYIEPMERFAILLFFSRI